MSTEKVYASPTIAVCRYCGVPPGQFCLYGESSCEANYHESRWRDAQGVEIARLRDLLQEATEGQECMNCAALPQAFCVCGAAICASEACLYGRVDRAIGHRTKGACRA